MTDFIPIGTVVAPFGTISAVAWIDGERFYFLTDEREVVTLFPESAITKPRSEPETEWITTA